MVTVACKEFKNRLGKYLDLVRGGEAIEITDRGKPIARILPVVDPQQRRDAAIMESLIKKGSIRLATGRITRFPKPVVLGPGVSIAGMIAEDRR